MADLYEVLGVSPSATDKDIKQAYRRRSLETHPDRFPVGSPEQEETTVRFQEVNSAYYVLSDPERRQDYDTKRSSGVGAGGGYGSFPKESDAKANAQFNKEFKSTFETMMGEEGRSKPQLWFGLWAVLGGLAGVVLGFIIFNFPGAMIGAVGGFTLGRIRDVRKKAVYEVFQELPHAEKARLLSGLLTKVMTQVA
jgi:hypothetical protein